jgi:hypothetical protein
MLDPDQYRETPLSTGMLLNSHNLRKARIERRAGEFPCSGRVTVQQEVRLKEEHDRPMERRPQVDEAEVAFPKTA